MALQTQGQILRIPSADVTLTAEAFGDVQDPPVVLLHGGGQTRHAWTATAVELGRRGWRAVTVDLRGHGDSGWSIDGVYDLDRYAGDVMRIAEFVGSAPVLVGASLGGSSALAALGSRPEAALGLVLVDTSPYVQLAGTDRVREFMSARARDGFASLTEAAEYIARYLPHRKRPQNSDGLTKNLRERSGRWYWHWDPRVIAEPADLSTLDGPLRDPARLGAAAGTLRVPTLLVRGGKSDVLTVEDARKFIRIVPHAEYVSVAGARHMVAGDDNVVFQDVLWDFLERRIRPRLALLTA